MRTPRLAPALLLLLAACGEDLPPTLDMESYEAALTRASYVGRDACAVCHPRETELWVGSHHDLAMDEATEKTVLGDFDDAVLEHYGVTSTFFRRDGRYVVRTEGPDGKLADFEIAYVFGVTPLQQYLVPFPGGRYQVLPLCWDSRPEDEGGQRWFHIYPDERIPPGDVLFWAGPNQNWNYVCAECHSTDLKKNYDPEKNAYATGWEEIDVSCEACHGPGSAHVQWAEKIAGLAEKVPPGPALTRYMAPTEGRLQIEGCARCHSRRVQISEEYRYGKPLLDTHRLTLLIPRMYYDDGQIRDEVYVYGSFLQSRMFHEGVVCTDCHDAHSLKRHAEGNALCDRCHEPEKYDVKEHHFHEPGTEGSFCVECHMPQTTYMVVDPRADHSLRVPRPDLSVKIGTPNACNGCHDDKTAEWSVEQVAKWYGKKRIRGHHYGEDLHAGRIGAAGAAEALVRLVLDATKPAIARASALEALSAGYPGADLPDIIRTTSEDPEAMVRAEAARAIEALPPESRAELALPLLDDPVRLVRIEAARALAPVPLDRFPGELRTKVRAAFEEYEKAESVNADRGAAHSNLAMYHAERGHPKKAEEELRKAIELEPTDLRSYINLADLYRSLGRDLEAEVLLRRALAGAPEDAALHHSLGLTLVRLKRYDEALASLRTAAELLPDNARFTLVYAVALRDTGDRGKALEVMEKAVKRNPGNAALSRFLESLR